MKNHLINATKKIDNIKKSNLTIYDMIEIGDNDYWLTSSELQAILEQKLVGFNTDFPIKTRSKVVKS
ncbi:MAG: restriction endonuclease, partial [Bacteroidota bacterium]